MIWVDYRERNSGVIRELKKNHLEHEIRSLAIGDYVVDNQIFIERKASQDFVNSLHSGRLFKQVAMLKKFGRKQLLIVEGPPLTSIRGLKPEMIRGALVSLAVAWQLPVLYSRGPGETVLLLKRIHEQFCKRPAPPPVSLFKGRKPAGKETFKRQVLEALPSVGPKMARELLREFGTLDKIFGASEDELLLVKGIGRGKVKKIKDILRERKADYSV